MDRKELEKQAKALNVEFNAQTSDEVLALKIEAAEAKAEVAEVSKLNEEVNERLQAQEKQLKSKSKLPIVTIDKVDYQITVSQFLHTPLEIKEPKNGERIKGYRAINQTGESVFVTADELANDKELCKQLITRGSGVLVKVADLSKRAEERAAKLKSRLDWHNQARKEATTA